MRTHLARFSLVLGLALLLPGCGNGDGDGHAQLREVDLLAYGVSQIFIPVDEERPPAQGEALIRQADRALASGEDFAAVARGRSQHPAASDGGFLGFVTASADTAFSGAVQSLRPGQVSPPIRTQYGWHIIKRHPFEEARALDRKLRIPTYGVVVGWDDPQRPKVVPAGRTRAEAERLAGELVGQLASGTTTLEEAAKRYANARRRTPDPYLGPTARREGNEHIFDALAGAEPGQILGPFDTPDGFAVLVRGRYLRSLFRHVLISHIEAPKREMGAKRTAAQALDLARRVLAEALADRDDWDRLVETYSDDPWSRTTRGRMGVLSTGDMPEGFETFVYDQEPDTIHPHVVASPFGFHVVWKVN